MAKISANGNLPKKAFYFLVLLYVIDGLFPGDSASISPMYEYPAKLLLTVNGSRVIKIGNEK